MTQDEEIIKLLLFLGFTKEEILDLSKQDLFNILPSIRMSDKDLL